ncbi:N-6 DNA methylase [Shewanella oneidensis MR-1]|uniref:site-specific DNA-methyltransferase (adenine-specific) n=1 Tax=Shewanella oneidensis (strain ATCC 700550 / JCM 31522 / CIP 106686 / LMG 19005 / NCIMB 14063 / MR-1) TaxID=211586 RepID=Q8E9K6_SHEON|nr:N-6 DNA methylase [Shewanella oneidensis]AAN57236.1 type I restriction-modification system N6-adenine DNA methyltransferase HsdM [Shewanella oneidensis MR-1]MDX5998450.1 N-6 DNA methylase [Shewanella oneidensis]MEE2030179.1 Type I restriction enzyme EcoKI M protein [Shewanella oneidensis]QKG94599.1 N-6 DNA methylase [Shewanella oneidensis MR-1]
MSITSSNSDIVQKLWNLCDVLRDDGINYSDYVTELVLLLFIKMVHENTEAGLLNKHTLPTGCRWTDLNDKDGLNLLDDYKRILLTLSTGKDSEGNTLHADPLILAIYADAQTRLREPRHLKQLIKSLDSIDWFSAQKDGLGDLYEGLLEKNANETKSGAGQYFTPRALIDSMVRVINPQAGEVIQDPAAGTAGFLIAAHEFIKNADNYDDLTLKEIEHLRNKAFIGVELVPSTRRLALMNCLLHGMEGDDEGVVHLGNSLGQVGMSLPKADIILANPPFGTSKGGDASITRDDLTYPTSNKQLAFLQHIYRNLKPGGRAAVVLPDNVLFEAGVGTDVRRDLMYKCNLHTILRLPTGIFYAAGVKTNVLFFTKGSEADKLQEENCTTNTWVYDLRTNMPNFGKRTPFGEQHLTPFEAVYDPSSHSREGGNPDLSARKEGEWSFNAEAVEIETTEVNQGIDERLAKSRWRVFSREFIRDTKGDSLDISWLKDSNSVDAADLGTPEELAGEAMTELKGALADLEALMKSLGAELKTEVKG